MERIIPEEGWSELFSYLSFGLYGLQPHPSLEDVARWSEVSKPWNDLIWKAFAWLRSFRILSSVDPLPPVTLPAAAHLHIIFEDADLTKGIRVEFSPADTTYTLQHAEARGKAKVTFCIRSRSRLPLLGQGGLITDNYPARADFQGFNLKTRSFMVGVFKQGARNLFANFGPRLNETENRPAVFGPARGPARGAGTHQGGARGKRGLRV